MKQYDKKKVEESLSKVDFPADKKKIMDQAKENGTDNEEIRILARIEERSYGNVEEVIAVIEEINMGQNNQNNNKDQNNKNRSNNQNQKNQSNQNQNQRQQADAMA